MSLHRVLAVDTAYDPQTQIVYDMRFPAYQRLGAALEQLGPSVVERRVVLETLARADAEGRPFEAILVTSHGGPSCVYDKRSPNGVLLSVDFHPDELERWARGRALYFMSCDTGRGMLLRRLSELGATLVVGFASKPRWSNEGHQRWMDFDAEMIDAVTDTPCVATAEAVRARWLERIAAWLPDATFGYKFDLEVMQETLKAMVIS